MTKELVTIEFRYHDKPNGEGDCRYKTKTITIGVFETLDDAMNEGNKALNILSKSFEVRADDKFKLNHLFGSPKRLVTNTCYTTNGIQYFAKITSLEFDNLADVVNETFNASNRYKEFKRLEQD